MEVFEPRSNAFSTMCGNGLRAVCRYWMDRGYPLRRGERFLIQTRSGVRAVTWDGGGRFAAEMGRLSTRAVDLARYVALRRLRFAGKRLERVRFPRAVEQRLPRSIDAAIIGLSGDRKEGRMDGEPHLVFFFKRCGLPRLRGLARTLGRLLATDRALFPREINVSAACLGSALSLCTYERGVYSVTRSCGTASTVAAGFLLQRTGGRRMDVRTLGGRLVVEQRGRQLFLTGDARRRS